MKRIQGPNTDPATPLTATDLVGSHAGRALALARRIVVDEQLAEDVVQEAFLAYWRNPASFDPSRGSFGSWFLALVHHKAVDAVRRASVWRRRTDAAGELPVDVPDIAESVTGRADGTQVRTALAALPAVQREALVLAYWGGFTQREIASRTGAPLGTVETRVMAGMRRLHEALEAVVPELVVDSGLPPVATA